MPKTAPFDEHAGRYEEWFEKNPLLYEAELRAKSLFYGDAVFYSREEIVRDLEASGFLDSKYYQTLCGPGEAAVDIEPVREGYRPGSLLVIRGMKERSAAWAPMR